MNRLTVRQASTVGEGYHADGAGLYLQVTGAGARSWIMRYTLRGRAREMGLGPLAVVSLAEARQRAQDARKLLHQGVDPIEARERDRARLAHVFADVATEYITANKASWRNAKHQAQWSSTIARYAEPSIGRLPVDQITATHALKILEPIWKEKTETATRVRQRCEAIIDYATVRKYRAGDNPFRWRGNLDKLLPHAARVAKRAHLAAMPYAEVPAFMQRLARTEGMAALALRFTILTCSRTGESLGARWPEIDMHVALWTVPASRMKAGREHVVPLSAPALETLREVRPLGDGVIFPYRKRSMSENAMRDVLVRLGVADRATVHGFRSAFRDWCSEETDFQSDVAEMALAHAIKNKVEAAYRRGALLRKRRELADAWAAYCCG